MNHAVKIDERAFNRGVKEALQLKPLIRVVRSVIEQSECKAPTVRQEPKDKGNK